MNNNVSRDVAGCILACVFFVFVVAHATTCIYLYRTYDLTIFILGALTSQLIMIVAFTFSWHYVDSNFEDVGEDEHQPEEFDSRSHFH